MMKRILLYSIAFAAATLTGSLHARAQGLSVNTTGAAAATSAMLDIGSTTKGLLIPRLTTTQMNAISSPATGLWIYNTTANSFYYYDGSAWTAISASGAPTGAASGDLTGTYPGPTLATSGVAAGTYGSATQNTILAIDAKGRVTSATTTPLFNNTGSTTTILHANPVGAPSFSAVNLASEINGNLPVSRLNTGTGASSSTFWRGDGTWAAAGNGTVTNVTTGNLSPIFTSSVTTGSSTPAISYTLSNAGAYTVLTNSTNATAAPTYTKVDPAVLLNLGGTASSTTFYRGDGQWQTMPVSTGYTINSAVSATTTLTAGTNGVVPVTGSSKTITLPAANSVPAGRVLILLLDNASGLNITTQGSDALHLPTGASLTAGTPYSVVYYVYVISNGVNFWNVTAFY